MTSWATIGFSGWTLIHGVYHLYSLYRHIHMCTHARTHTRALFKCKMNNSPKTYKQTNQTSLHYSWIQTRFCYYKHAGCTRSTQHNAASIVWHYLPAVHQAVYKADMADNCVRWTKVRNGCNFDIVFWLCRGTSSFPGSAVLVTCLLSLFGSVRHWSVPVCLSVYRYVIS